MRQTQGREFCAASALAAVVLALGCFAALPDTIHAQQPFTLKQVLSAPYATSLTASPVGARFAWVEDAEGVHNLWIGGANEPARQVTHYTDDDGQDLSSLVWLPDGKAIAYIYGASNGASGAPANPAHLQRSTALRLIVQPLDPAAKPFDIPAARAPLFLPDGHSVLFLRQGKIWAADLSSTGISGDHQLVYDRGNASQMTLSPDGKLLAYVSGRRSSDQARSFLGLFDLEAKTLRFVAPSTGRDFAPAFSPDSKQLAWLRGPITEPAEFDNQRVSANPWSIQLADVSTLAAHTVFTPEANKPGSVLPHLATGEPKLFWAINANSGFIVQNRAAKPRLAPVSFDQKPAVKSAKEEEADGPPPDRSNPWLLFFSEAEGYVHLFGVNPQDPTSKPVRYSSGMHEDERFEVEDLALAPDKRMVYYSSNQAGDDKLDGDRRHIWAEYTEPYFGGVGPVQITAGEGVETHPVLSSDGKWIAVLASTPTQPMHVQFVETQTIWAPSGNLRPAVAKVIPAHTELAPAQYPGLKLVRPAQVLFDAPDGLHLHGQLFLPKIPPASGKRATIIFVHGGPRRQMLLGYPNMDYYSNAYAMNQYLASRGFIVLSVNYRCGIGYGLDFRQCEGQGATGAKEYNDVLGAVKYLHSRADVDPKRIGIWGGSYGGYLTALALARNSDLFAAGVDFHGVHEWSLEDNAPADWLRGPITDRPKIEALAHASSPMGDIDKWKSPILLIHGDDDPEVAYAQTPLLAEALRARKLPVEELVFPDEVHGFLLHKDWLAAYEATAAFFERVLKPEAVK